MCQLLDVQGAVTRAKKTKWLASSERTSVQKPITIEPGRLAEEKQREINMRKIPIEDVQAAGNPRSREHTRFSDEPSVVSDSMERPY